jgi:hypothetical protein
MQLLRNLKINSMKMLMKRLQVLFTVWFILGNIHSQAQNVSINTSGTPATTGAILDLSNNSSSGLLLPNVSLTNAAVLNPPITGGNPAQLSGLMVFNTSPSLINGLSGAGLYYWNNSLANWICFGNAPQPPNYLARWITAASLGIGVAQDNGSGVAISSIAMTPKSMLDVSGGIAIGTYAGTIAAPANGMIVPGQTSVGNNLPNGKAIIDLSNGNNQGLLLPAAAAMPAVAASENGLVIFNSTLGCPEYAFNGTWTTLPPHGSVSFHYVGPLPSPWSWTVPPCVTTIKVIAAGAAGGAGWNSSCTNPPGGPGAIISATVTVVPGHILKIVTASQGGGNTGWAGGGGGGTFIWDNNTNTLLVAAGGGGGGGGQGGGSCGWPGCPGSATTTPTDNGQTGAAGAGGGAGARGTGTTAGGPGAGWLTGAGVGMPVQQVRLGDGGSGHNAGAGSYVGGWGGNGGCAGGGNGGWGGGGGGGDDNCGANSGGGGGGGGYNGGGGGNGNGAIGSEYGGGGGGSGYYNGVSIVSPQGTAGFNEGNGYVIIHY